MRYFITTFIALLFFGCGGSNDKANNKQPTSTYQVVEKDIQTPPDQGGYGFEKIAADLGYSTYVWSEEKDKTFFGDPRAKKGGSIHFINGYFPNTMRIHGQNSNLLINNRTISELCYEALLSLHPVTLEFIPSLASHWFVSEDKMTYKFRINPDARWWDGMPVTSDDVIATWDLMMDETILEPSSQLVYEKYERPVAESKYIVSVTSKSLNWRNLLYFSASMSLHPHHILKDIDGTEYLENYAFTLIPGTGPYKIEDKNIKNQESYVLERRDDYWAKDVPFKRYSYNFDKIKISAIKENDALVYEKFKKGEQDIYPVRKARRWVEETNFEASEKGWVKKHKIYSDIPVGTRGYFFNMREWPFDDKRVRYAFSYLYDREKINRELMYNEYVPIHSQYSNSVYENPNNEKFNYNPEKALELLKQAGYTKRNSDGWLVQEGTGKVLRFEINIYKSLEERVTTLQQMLKEYGIDMQIKFMDFNSIIKNVNERNFKITSFGYSGLAFPNPETSMQSSLADKNNNNNIWGFKSARVDELLKEYDVAFDITKRIKIIQEIDGIWAEVHPTAYGLGENNRKTMWWNKFGYPDWVHSRYGGEFWDAFTYWWYDEEADARLKSAMSNDQDLPIEPIEIKFWPAYKVKNI